MTNLQPQKRADAGATLNLQPQKRAAAGANSQKKTAAGATTNLRPAQEVVAWASTALVDVDAGGVRGAVLPADVAAAGAWSDEGAVRTPGGERCPKCGCT